MPVWGRLGSALADTLWPPACAACGAPPQEDTGFCHACLGEITPPQDPLCPACGRPGSPGPCSQCQKNPPAFSTALAPAMYSGPVAKAVRDYKYNRRWALGAALGKLLAARSHKAWLDGVDVVIPVPLHRWRLFFRGFNQAQVLAGRLCAAHGLALAPELLGRVRHTKPQVGLSPGQRRANVAGAFALAKNSAPKLAGAGVLLIDDVFTTGATCHQCARVLKAGGAKWVRVLTLARAGAVAGHGQPGYDLA